MPARTLPVISRSELQKHKTHSSCYVAYGSKVFNITPFLADHPGGGELILEYGGRDVQEIMGDEVSHTHSEAAYEVLADHLVGFLEPDVALKSSKKGNNLGEALPSKVTSELASGLPADDLDPQKSSKETEGPAEKDLLVVTDPRNDFRAHKFLDLDRPLFMQVWNGGFSKEFYLTQVHRPRHYKSGESAPLFGNFLEPLSKTPWWVVPTVWLPPDLYGTYISRDGLSNWAQVAAFWLIGLAIWTIVEYGLHRCLFHIDR